MHFTERYIAEVTRRLPAKQRAEVAREIGALIEDMVADHASEEAALLKLGDPAVLARKYAETKQYLIGPLWFESYVCTLKYVLSYALPFVALGLFIAGSVTEGQTAPSPFWDSLDNIIGEVISGVFNVAVQIVFWTTAVFVFLERTDAQPKAVKTGSAEVWSVAQLPELPKQRQISLGESISGLVFACFVPVFVLYVWFSMTDDLAMMTSVWSGWLVFFVALEIVTIAVNVAKIKIGNWTWGLTFFNGVVCLATAVFGVGFLLLPDVFSPILLNILIDQGVTADPMDIKAWIDWSVAITAITIVVTCLWEIIKSVRLAVLYNRVSPQGIK